MTLRKKVLFIVNPISGTKRQVSLDQLLPKHLDASLFDWEVYFTKGRGDATNRAKAAAEHDYDVVAAVGGDGTINEVAQGIVGTEVLMAVVPNGSGNGFANYFNISHDPAQAIGRINSLNHQKIDTATFNGQLFLSVAGLGFDAHVAHAFDRHGVRGFWSYAKLSLQMFRRYEPAEYEIHADGSTLKVAAFLITVANASQFGNNAYIAPTASIDDGLLDVVIIKPLNIWIVVPVALRLFTKTLHKSRSCRTIQAKNISIKTNDAVSQIDGEPMIALPQNEIRISAQSLNMIV